MLRDIARWAVASSLGATAGCHAHQPELELSQSEPTTTSTGHSNSDPGGAGMGGATGGGAGTVTLGSGGTTPPTTANDPDGNGGIGGAGGVGGVAGSHETGGRGGGTMPPDPSDDWKPIDCAGGQLRVLVNVAFAHPFDYAGLYATYPGGVGMGGPYDAWTSLLDSTGTECSGATDIMTCLGTLGPLRMPSNTCAQAMTCAPFLITTQGDEVTRSDERSALLTLLGAIDSEYKAALLAMFDGHAIACPFDPGSPFNETDPPLTGTETRSSSGGFDLRTESRGDCLENAYRETIHVEPNGAVTTIEEKTQIAPSTCVAGRRPEGLRPSAAVQRRRAIGAYFAEAARMEAASVHAFERLARELDALGAPRALIARALQAALDEIRHARVTGSLARRFGSEPLQALIEPMRARSALEIALENAVEGCVRETYGALLAHHQAQAARDPHVREAMQRIAEDETRHAELSWHVARWLEPRLSRADRRRLVAARSAALAQLFTELDPGLPPRDARALGLPAPDVAARMLERLGAALGVA
jgi:hypothetical protein